MRSSLHFLFSPCGANDRRGLVSRDGSRSINSSWRRAGAALTLCLACCGLARAEKLVVGHQMLAMPRYGGSTSVEQMREEVRQWKDLGLDGTMLFDIGSDAFRNNARRYHQAGAAEGYKFAISTSYFPSSQIGAYATFLAELGQPSTSAARLFYNGRPYLSAYHAPGHFQGLVSQLRSTYGIDAYAEPQMFPRLFNGNPNGQNWDAGGITGMSAANLSVMMNHPAWSQVQGFAAFEITASINGQADAVATLWDATRARGKTARASIVPYYKGLAHKGNWMVYEGWGFARMQASWKRAIESGVPAVEIITLNDFAESSYINSWAKDDPVMITDHWNKGDVPALLDHSGFRYFSKRYVQWFKTGREPAITKDELYYAYRLHPRDATSYYYLSSQEKTTLQKYLPSGVNADWMYRKDGLPESFKGWGPNWSMGIDWRKFSDGIHVAVRLAAPADVYINGTKVGSNLPAGEHLLVKPGSRYDGGSNLGYPLHTFTSADFGKPRFEIRRNGQTVMSHTGELEITAYPVPGCWNIFARMAPSSGGTASAVPGPTTPATPVPPPPANPVAPAPVAPAPAVPAGPAPLASADIGSPSAAGSTSYDASSGQWQIRATGADIWGGSDQFRFVHDAVAGDAELVVRVRSLTAADAWTKAGLMFRSSVDAGSAHVSLFVTPANGVRMQWRTSTGGSSSTSGNNTLGAPQWLKLVRAGNTFSAFRSGDGATWELVHRAEIALPGSVRAGLAVTSHHATTATTASLDNYVVKTATAPAPATPAPATPAAPAPPAAPTAPAQETLASSDIGSPAIAGSTSFSSGTYTLRAGGTDIWGGRDQFRFARTQINGDGEVVVRVKSVSATDHWTKTGLMFRASLLADAAHASLFLSPGAGVTMQWRNSSGGSTSNTVVASMTAPRWLRLARAGNTFTACHSADGVSWVKINAVAVGLPANAYAGLALTSHNQANAATAVLDNLAIKGAGSAAVPAAPPTPPLVALTGGDVGGPGLAGSYSPDSGKGTYTLRAAGNDIWNVSDQFQFARKQLTGDVELTVRISSLGNTDSWAKAGLMLRASAQGNAAYAGVFVTPANGVVMQWRTSSGAIASSSASRPGKPPQWLRLMRDGNAFYAFSSADGKAWDLVEFTNVNLPASVLGGLVACSHNTGSVTTAVFEQMTID